uniref:Putative reverse transcriptase domain-containing protein n=1 Tax=Tanacetum cinerariifolium TaxID=118510 RepID=A0A6L2JA62_TANCI|nr:putative reverse transcriptase domain-containing protein [Tanacetum cinerariifolium]
MKVEESLNVTFDETPPPPKTIPLEEDDLVEEQAIEIGIRAIGYRDAGYSISEDPEEDPLKEPKEEGIPYSYHVCTDVPSFPFSVLIYIGCSDLLLLAIEDFVVYCDASNQGMECVLMQRGKKELNMGQRRGIELFSDYDCKIHYHLGKENVVADVFSRKEMVKPKQVGAISMTIQSCIKEKLLAAQNKATKEENALVEILRGLGQQIEKKGDGGQNHYGFITKLPRSSGGYDTIWRWTVYNTFLAIVAETLRNAIGYELLVLCAEVGENRLIVSEMVQETTDKVDPFEEIRVDKTLCFVEEPAEIMDHEVKKLKRSRILIVKVRWNSKRGPEFT